MWNLYIPLIEHLYKDTEKFKEVDLMESMHLRAFFFVTDCIENEFKPLCRNDKETRIRLISEIINHPICSRFYGHIEVDKLCPILKKYYELIHKKDAKGIYSFTLKYRNNQQLKKKYVLPLMQFLTESKGIGTLYKKLRGR